MPQLTYNQNRLIAVAGMRTERYIAEVVVSYPCATGKTITPGTLCELAADGLSAQMTQTATGNANKLLGVALFDVTASQGILATPGTNGILDSGAVFVAGDMVTLMRKGRVWVNFNGTTIGNLVVANYIHTPAGVSAAANGYFTDAAVSIVSGSEVAASNCLFLGTDASVGVSAGFGLAKMEVNIPA